MGEDISSFICVPDDAAQSFRRRLGLAQSQTPRIAFVVGPADTVGTFNYWINGQIDPRFPVVPYMTMFYTLVDRIDAQALILSEIEGRPVHDDRRFIFSRVPRPKPNGRLQYYAGYLAFYLKVARHLRDYNPHVVIVGTDAPYWLLWALPERVRIVLTAHNTYWPMGRRSSTLKARLHEDLDRRLVRRISASVCTSEECKRQVVELRGGNPDGIFVETPQVLDRFWGTQRDSKSVRRILFLGRLEESKGVFDLLAAFDRLASHYPDLTLDFAGAGAAENELVARIADARAGDRIRFLGQLDAESVHRYLDEADVLVCPTRSSFKEGLALVVAEAAVHGVPTVLSAVVPAKDLVAGACMEFPADDAEALRSSIEALLKDPALFQALRQKVLLKRKAFSDRSLSWGTQLYKALVY